MLKNPDPQQTERELIEQAKTDPTAFGVIFDLHYSKILNYAIHRTGDVSLAQDITSEVFVKAMRALPKYEWRGIPISVWLYRIAGNELRMNYRKQNRFLSLDELQETQGFEPTECGDLSEEIQQAQDRISRHKLATEARTLINHLPQHYREVVVLRFGQNKKISEIALILGKREGTVKSLLSRAMARLRKALQDGLQPNTNGSILAIEEQSSEVTNYE